MAEDQTLVRVKEVFTKQQKHRWKMACSSASDRIARLKLLKHEIISRRAALFEALRADFSKHPVEVELTEVQPALVEIEHTIGHLARWMRPKRAGTPLLLTFTRSEVRYSPKEWC
jgi:aldehyde dehydrogenase (NAD+)